MAVGKDAAGFKEGIASSGAALLYLPL